MQKDMLVALYRLPQSKSVDGVRVVHAMTPNFYDVQNFIKRVFGDRWAGEVVGAFGKHPVSCMVALNRRNEIVGFAGYDCTAPGYFGPTGVDPEYRGLGIGRELLLGALRAMREQGYGYAVIGGVEPHNIPFYQHACGAVEIDGSESGIYADMAEK